MDVKISKKDYNYIYREVSGLELKTNIELYNSIFHSAITISDRPYFLVYTNDEVINIEKNEKYGYIVQGVFIKEHFYALELRTRFVFIVDLLDECMYRQNSGAGRVQGKVKEIKKYKMNFFYNDFLYKKNTFLNFIEEIGYGINNIGLEKYALLLWNTRLFENICKYKHTTYVDYDKYYENIKLEVLRHIKINNTYCQELQMGVRVISDFETLVKYIHKNRSKFLDESNLLYASNDDMRNIYPINMVGTNVSLDMFNGYNFNSALPFYFQYRNYKVSTQLLADVFFDEIIKKENLKRENEIKLMKYYFGNQPLEDLEIVDTTNYGLYFPLLMSFRQSVELAFKLIFVNEKLKKQTINNAVELRNYTKKIDTHDLIKLVNEIQDCLENDVYDFLYNLSSFIYYNEGTDASFSRYIVDREMKFVDLKKITIYYVDLHNYIKEFYAIMDKVLAEINFGFDINNVFTNKEET